MTHKGNFQSRRKNRQRILEYAGFELLNMKNCFRCWERQLKGLALRLTFGAIDVEGLVWTPGGIDFDDR